MRLAALAVCLLAAQASAQSAAVAVMDAQGVPEAVAHRVHRTATELLRQLSSLQVGEGLDWKAPRKGCAKDDGVCMKEKLRAAGAAQVLALWVTRRGDSIVIMAAFIDQERTVATKGGDAEADALDLTLRTLLEAVVPQWARKGWGGFRLEGELPPGTVLKLDGRVLKKTDTLSALAGSHQLDVLYPDGRGVLQQLDVQEGDRTRVDVSPPEAVSGSTSSARVGISGLRGTSYAMWMVGAATLLSSFIVAYVGRQTAEGQSPCRLDSRECVTFEMAAEQQRKAQGYAFTANVLLGTGLALSLIGATLFTIDVAR